MFSNLIKYFILYISIILIMFANCENAQNVISSIGKFKSSTAKPFTTLQTTTIIPKSKLNGPCQVTADCGPLNTYCHQIGTTLNPAGLCQCLLGHLPSSDQINCYQFNCTGSSDACREQFGNYTKCYYRTNLCKCDTSFKLNAQNQTCQPDRLPLDSNCSADRDCGANTACGLSGHRECICRLGCDPVPSNWINCAYANCAANSDCSRFSDNTLCLNGRCYCNQQNSTLDHDTQKCIFHGQAIGGNCTQDTECGSNANCIQGSCLCQFGMLPLANNCDCQLLNCASDLDCIRQIDHNSHCTKSICYCDSGFDMNPLTQTCVGNVANTKFNVSFNFVLLFSILILLIVNKFRFC